MENISFEPRKVNRFIIKFPEKLGIASYLVKAIKRPHILSTYNGEYSVSNIDLEFYDVVHLSILEKLVSLITLNEVFDLTLEMLDATGLIVETIVYKETKLLSIKQNNLDWSNDELSRIEASFITSKIEIKA